MRGGRAKRDGFATVIEEAVSLRSTPLIRPDFVGPPSPARGGRLIREKYTMPRSKLLVRPSKSANGIVHRVTPKSAGWTYVGFEARDLKKGARVSLNSGAMEACVVVLSGKA